jgi:type II secretory pathway pseudopilin PulG
MAEMLVALALMALIAAFVVPKISISGGEAERKAKFKQAITSMRAAVNKAKATSYLTASNFSSTRWYDLLANNLDGVAVYCPSRCRDGCSSSSQDRDDEPGFLMSNGVSICGFNNDVDSGVNWSLDYNNTAGNSVNGVDQMEMWLEWSSFDGYPDWSTRNTASQEVYDTLW